MWLTKFNSFPWNEKFSGLSCAQQCQKQKVTVPILLVTFQSNSFVKNNYVTQYVYVMSIATSKVTVPLLLVTF